MYGNIHERYRDNQGVQPSKPRGHHESGVCGTPTICMCKCVCRLCVRMAEAQKANEGTQAEGTHRGTSREHPQVAHNLAGRNGVEFQCSSFSCNALSTPSYGLHDMMHMKQLLGFVAAFPIDFTFERPNFLSAQACDLSPQGLCPHSSEEQFVLAQESACSLGSRWD